MSNIRVISKDDANLISIKLYKALKNHLKSYELEYQNQILKAADQGIYLFLDSTFLVNDLRNIRKILSEDNFLSNFIDLYSRRDIDETIFAYEYDIKYTNDKSYIIIELIDKYKLNNIAFSEKFEDDIFIMETKKHSNNIFLSKIYKNKYPFASQKEIESISKSEFSYICNVIGKEMHHLNRVSNKNYTEHLYGKISEISYNKEVNNIKTMRGMLYEIVRKIDDKESLKEDEILTLNNLINKQKYNILLNLRYSHRKD